VAVSRWKLAVCGVAVACIACGSAAVERTSAGTAGQGFGVSSGDQRSMPAQTANPMYLGSTNGASIVKRVGTTKPVPPPTGRLAERDAPLQPASANNPCGRTGKPAPSCPVAAP
jgi:hypothetical protein